MNTSTAPKLVAENARVMAEEITEVTKTALEKTAKLGDGLADLNKGNVEALAVSVRVAAKGAEALTQVAADYSKKSFETATATLKSLAAIKSPTELFQLQSEYAKTSFDCAIAGASKFNEAWVKLVGDLLQPLSSRLAANAQKVRAVKA